VSEAKRLLEQATPLPWRVKSQSGTFRRAIEGGPNRGWVVGEIRNFHDAALVEEAVNRLPDYEAAVDALESVLGLIEREHTLFDDGTPVLFPARAALRRLRGTE